MRISDWSSDVCSSDLTLKAKRPDTQAVLRAAAFPKDFDAYMANMGWMSEHYVRLRRLMGDARARGASEQALDRLALNLDRARILPRSDEHTSELQSLMRSTYAVFCLKKKKHTCNIRIHA